MPRVLRRFLLSAFLFSAVSVFTVFRAFALPIHQPAKQSAAELITAVNALRASHGLGSLAVHPILMQTAQAQADALLATGGGVGHARPNGITFTQQLLMLGFPLAGDLSLGGYRAENWVGGRNLSVQGAIEFWLGDEPHTNTMLSIYLSDIGAGMTIGDDGTVYYVVDTALQTGTKVQQPDATLFFAKKGVATGTVDPQSLLVSQYIVPVTVATALPNGDVFHTVLNGQSLWSIAIRYGTTIEQIRRLNNLGQETKIFVGQILLIRRQAANPTKAQSFPTIEPTVFQIQIPSPPVTDQPILPASSGAKVEDILVPIIIGYLVLMTVFGVWQYFRNRYQKFE
jgi:uncharacterized protein YkwD